jgi:anti-anti-sigma regulatory factor
LVVFFMGNVPFVDLAGAEFLTTLYAELRQKGIELRLAEARGEVREALRRIGGREDGLVVEANQTVDDVLNRWKGATPLRTG